MRKDERASIGEESNAMSQQELETRLLALEQDVAVIKQQLSVETNGGDWISRKSGRFRDFPEWEEVCRLGAQLRKADRLADDQDGAD
jgi:hypothetical protein